MRKMVTIMMTVMTTIMMAMAMGTASPATAGGDDSPVMRADGTMILALDDQEE